MSEKLSCDSIQSDVIELGFLEKVSRRLPEDIDVLQALAELYTRTGRFKEGQSIDLQLSQLLPNDCLVWYNLGCSHALTGCENDAFDALAKAVDLGYADYDWMKTDPDLNNLRRDPRFESILSWLYTACNEDEC